MNTFGEWLRGQRTARGLTRKEFARRVGCSVAMLRKIEDGERRPSTQIAELMANCLDTPLEQRSTFVRVARGELRTDRLQPESKAVTAQNLLYPKNNLPVFPTPLIGREHELEQLSQLLRDSHCRLLTLVGPGGIGKTRLAIETASQIQNDFLDGVYFVSLVPVNSYRLLIPVIADSIGFNFQSAIPTDLKTQLLNYLKEKHSLLLIDNLEHLLNEQGIAELLTEIIRQAPQIKLITTSRESLNLQGEWVFEVHGLPIPEEDRTEGTSVELFLQRARRAHVEFNATTDDYPSILGICDLVDGMPLGIELAAAWVRTLSCDEIERELKRGLDILTISARDIPVRHRSMRAVFDHSWKLLTEDEQRVLLRLSIFRGGFHREAAEAVTDATLSVLSSLITKSLIHRSGEGRYDLHELIRQFVAERFDGFLDEQNVTQARHGRYFLSCFSQADERLRSSVQRETLAELTVEMDNFRAAWDWAINQGEFALIEQTMRTFFRLYDTRGWFQEGTDLLRHAMDALEIVHGNSPPDRTEQVALGHLLATHSWLAYRVANYKQAQEMLERSLEILRPLNEPRVLVESITYLGRVMEMTGNYSKALELYSEGLEVAAAIDDRWFKAVCLTLHTALVGINHNMVNPEITHKRLQSVVADWRLIGDPRLIAFALDFLSRSARRLGRYEEARAALEENAALNESIGFGWGLGTAYRGLGIVAQAQEDHQQAVDMFHESLEIFTKLGGSWYVARVLAELGRSIFALGNESEAERVWREALHIATDIHGMPVALEALVGFANLKTKQGDMEHALGLILIVLDNPASLQETKNQANRLRAELNAQLTPTQIESIQIRIAEKTFDAVVEDLLR